jgi:hypothetical protein
VEFAGRPGASAAADARGFIGIGFRLHDGRFEYIYLRPTNGRAADQVRRNHSIQYSSFPDFDFARLRKEAPEKYESYVDLDPGAWTRCRLVVQGSTARLFVHGADQPALIVNDLKLADSSGAVALWIGRERKGQLHRPDDQTLTPSIDRFQTFLSCAVSCADDPPSATPGAGGRWLEAESAAG